MYKVNLLPIQIKDARIKAFTVFLTNDSPTVHCEVELLNVYGDVVTSVSIGNYYKKELEMEAMTYETIGRLVSQLNDHVIVAMNRKQKLLKAK